MVTIEQSNVEKSIKKTAEALKSLIQMPEWAMFVKTGAGRERPPVELDWWYMRATSILRTVYVKGPIGVSKLKVKYGKSKNRGHKPSQFYPAAGKIIRVILQQLEKASLIQNKKEGIHKGRVITAKGQSLLSKNTVK